MPVTSVTKDPEALTMTLVGDFPVTVERLWEAFTDARQIERFWGPPGFPATFEHHDVRVGGGSRYHMTGPDGERHGGYWEFVDVDPPHHFEVVDGFATATGDPDPAMPSMRMVYDFSSTDTGSRLRSTTYFPSLEAFEQLLEMGMETGATLAMGQLDLVLADLRELALGRGTAVEPLTDTTVRITRFVDHPRDIVWRAYTTPELVRRWLLGPDGWSMPTCEIDLRVGGRYRFGWAPDAGTEGEPFGFDGETRLVEPPTRWVTTESMTGTAGPPATNDVTFLDQDGGTLITFLIEYPDRATRDAVLATGMADGMEASFARMEALLVGA